MVSPDRAREATVAVEHDEQLHGRLARLIDLFEGACRAAATKDGLLLEAFGSDFWDVIQETCRDHCKHP